MPRFQLYFKGAFAFFAYANEIEVHVPFLKEHEYLAKDDRQNTFDYKADRGRHYCIQVNGSTHAGRFDPTLNVVMTGFHPNPTTPANARVCVFHVTRPDHIVSCDIARPRERSDGSPVSTDTSLFSGRHAGAIAARKFANGQKFVYDNAHSIDISPSLGEIRSDGIQVLVLIAEASGSHDDPHHTTNAFDASMRLMGGVDLQYAEMFKFTDAGSPCGEAELAPRACNGGVSHA